MKQILPSVIAMLALVGAFSCSKGGDDPEVAGKGGNAILKVTPRHHGKQIDSCTIYLKYNTVDQPSNGVYDDSAKCIQIGGLPVATFSGLRKGTYYIYGYGWDPGLTPPSHVKGAYAYPLTGETVQSYDLAVSED